MSGLWSAGEEAERRSSLSPFRLGPLVALGGTWARNFPEQTNERTEAVGGMGVLSAAAVTTEAGGVGLCPPRPGAGIGWHL